MRKLLAVLLTVLMLASALAVIPASAAETTGSGYTGDFNGLLISEVLHNSDYYGDGDWLDGFEYWELYNAGTGNINIYDYSLAKAPMFIRDPGESNVYHDYWDIWEMDKMFVHKSDIKSGNIVPQNAADTTQTPVEVKYTLQNDPEQGEIKPGEFAIVWFINGATLKALDQYMAENNITSETGVDPRAVFVENFSSLGNGFLMDSSTKIFLVWGYRYYYTENSTNYVDVNCVTGTDGSQTQGYMLGIVEDSFSLSQPAVGADGKVNDKVVALAPYGGALDSWKAAQQNASTVYVPSSTKPSYYIAERAFNGNALEGDVADYIAAGLAEAYIEAGCVNSSSVPTPGALDKLQWALAFPDKAPNSVSGGASDWATAYLTEYLGYIFPDSSTLENANEEEVIKIEPPDRERLQEIFFPSETTRTETITRLSLVGKILIAVGSVVVVAAVAVVVVLVLKKKKTA